MKRICLLLLCLTSVCVLTMPSVSAKKVTASISGAIHHPAQRIPAMKICAVNILNSRKICIKTKADNQAYKINGLSEGEYQVMASAKADTSTGGYMQQVQCIRAPCDPVPGNISLAAGESFDKADISFQTPSSPTATEKK
jgi:hypothetical protein